MILCISIHFTFHPQLCNIVFLFIAGKTTGLTLPGSSGQYTDLLILINMMHIFAQTQPSWQMFGQQLTTLTFGPAWWLLMHFRPSGNPMKQILSWVPGKLYLPQYFIITEDDGNMIERKSFTSNTDQWNREIQLSVKVNIVAIDVLFDLFIHKL